jgi:hypothetical protein
MVREDRQIESLRQNGRSRFALQEEGINGCGDVAVDAHLTKLSHMDSVALQIRTETADFVANRAWVK